MLHIILTFVDYKQKAEKNMYNNYSYTHVLYTTITIFFYCLQGSKGTVTVRLDVYGVNVCILNSHFQAHPENFAPRIEVLFTLTTFDNILKSLKM